LKGDQGNDQVTGRRGGSMFKRKILQGARPPKVEGRKKKEQMEEGGALADGQTETFEFGPGEK